MILCLFNFFPCFHAILERWCQSSQEVGSCIVCLSWLEETSEETKSGYYSNSFLEYLEILPLKEKHWYCQSFEHIFLGNLTFDFPPIAYVWSFQQEGFVTWQERVQSICPVLCGLDFRMKIFLYYFNKSREATLNAFDAQFHACKYVHMHKEKVVQKTFRKSSLSHCRLRNS